MNDNQSLTGRPDFRPSLGTAKPAQVARLNQHVVTPDGPSSDLMGLIQGLGTLNPTLQKIYDTDRTLTRMENVEEGLALAAKAKGDPRDVLTGAPVELPATAGPAYSSVTRDTYRYARTQQAAMAISQDIAGEYEASKDLPDFNAKAFLADKRQAALAGLTDPHQVAIVGEHLTQLEARIGTADQARLVKRQAERSKSTLFSLTEQALDPLMEPEHIAERSNWLLTQGAGLQVLPEEAGKAILRRVRSMAGDRPELFDAFDVPDAEGKTLRSKFPELSEEIDTGRRQAEAARTKAIHEATEADRFDSTVLWQGHVRERPEWVIAPEGQDALRSMIAPTGFTAAQAASMTAAAHSELAQRQHGSEVLQAARMGILGHYADDKQQKALEELQGPNMQQLWAIGAGHGDMTPEQRQRAIQAIAEQTLEVQRQTGATVAVRSLEHFLNTSVTTLPNADGPAPGFLASAEMFKALAANPQFRATHFKDKASDLMQTYNSLRMEEGLDEKTAYARAYEVNSPEAKERAQKLVDSPEFRKKSADMATKVMGSTSYVFGLFGTGEPTNTAQLQGALSEKVKEVARQNPHLPDSVILTKAQAWLTTSYILDETSQMAFRVPPGMAASGLQPVISEHSKNLTAELKKAGVISSESRLFYYPVGDSRLMNVVAIDDQGTQKLVKQVDAGNLQNAFYIKKNLQKTEAEALSSALLAAREGKPVTVDPLLIEKGKSSGFLKGEHVRALTEARTKATFAAHAGNPAFNLQPPTGNNTIKPKMDKQATVDQAMDFAFSNSLGVANHMDLAASLVTVREGVVLSAYGDPNAAAGLNIGAGYNLKGNAKTVNEDLRAVGVPAERLADVKEGRASLTGDQVKALTKLTLKRFEPEVIKVAERTKPGLWASLTAQQKAVMLDVAYQTGDASQYAKGWAALAAGNSEAFKAELKTYYTNHKGERVEDARSLDLRSTLLQGPSAWKARLKVASK